MYDQNRPEEPQRPQPDDTPARRRIGRSWGPAEEPAAEADDGTPQGTAQQEQYRFDPDRGRRHRYSEEPTGQVPGVPVEIAETGPMVPATRRPSPGEQFEPIPPAPQHPQTPQPESPFAPPGANQEYSAPPEANQGLSAPPGANQEYGTPPGTNHDYNATPGPGRNQDYSAPQPGANHDYGPAQGQQFSAPPSPHAPSAPPAAPSAPRSPAPPVPPTPANHPAPPPEGTEQAPAARPMPETAPRQAPTPSAPVLPSPVHGPVTEPPPRTPPTSRQPLPEPTPPVTTEDEAPDAESEQLLAWVRQVPGVRDAFHVTAPDGSPSLRLELEEGVDPDEVQAAVSAVVAEQRASTPGPQTPDEPGEEAQAELEPAAPAAAELPLVGAVQLRRVEIDSAGLDAEVSVTLAVGDYESTGAVTVPPVDWHVQHAAAAAAVEALRPYFGPGEARIEVEHASIVTTGPVKTAVVVVLWLDGRSVRRLAGAAVVTAERFRAVVSATLSALAAEVAQ
ncbi:hypothetical protein [Glycomyces arizonensis]|uniref:hypothetical protein n=1 Tax=Glycomyces arizonensis TaxID=256035 RepID=UPI00040FE083|nr:hypothetical protein [Glycomyces arizonensis]